MRVVAVALAILGIAACSSNSAQPAANGCGTPAGPDCTRYPDLTCPPEACGVQYGCARGIAFVSDGTCGSPTGDGGAPGDAPVE